MQRFENILVGVDVSQGERFVSDALPSPTIEAVERAFWLAKLNCARLTFFYALDVSAASQRMIEESEGDDRNVLDEAKDVLQTFVSRAAGEGLQADLQVGFGKSWLEIVRHALRHDHDLVVAGTRHLGMAQGLLLGSTGIKLLRKCPCPVWITQPQAEKQIKSILVAHCLRSVGDLAMELGCSMAELQAAQLHVLHSLEPHELEVAHVADNSGGYRSNAEQHIASQLASYKFVQPSQVHIVKNSPDAAVLDYIKKYDIELLVMGTIARTGFSGLITGNTAERLLPQIPCSVLAVKPPGFVSTVSV